MFYYASDYWINTVDYTFWQLMFNGVGCLFWVITYAVMVKKIIKNKFVEMPWFIACGNLAWEFIWSFFYQPDTGRLFALSYQGAFLLDIFIFIHVVMYGRSQLNLSFLKDNWKLISITCLVSWIPLNYFFVQQGYDTSIGANSGYILNIIISCLYPLLLLRNNAANFSNVIAWCKMLGTGLITVSMFLIYPNNYFIQTLGVLVLLLDCGYIYLLKIKKQELELNA